MSVPALFGLPTVVTRFLAVYQSEGEWSLARGLLRRANQWVGLTGLLVGAGVMFAGVFGWQGTRLWVMILAAPLVLLLVWTNLRQKALQGLHHPVAAQLPEQLIKHSAFLFIGIFLWLLGGGLARFPQGLMGVWLLASLLAFAVGALLLQRLSPSAIRQVPPRYQPRAWLATALPMGLAESVGVIYGATDIIVLGLLRPAQDVGLYQVALRTGALMLVFLSASNWVLAPWFARLHAGAERQRLQRLVTRTTRAVFAPTFVVFMVFVLAGHELLGLFFGHVFDRAYSVLLVLGAARLIDVAVGPVINLLAMTGGQRILAWTIGGAALINVIGCLVLIPPMGMLGAAVSTGLVMAVTNLFLAFIVHRHIGISSTILG
jgi:O-antigen/teichoic acid export membrane protein